MPRERKFRLNAKERAVLAALDKFKRVGAGSTAISDLAARAFRKKGSSSGTKGNSWVRNSLRKLVRLGLAGHAGARSGRYFRTDVELADLAGRAAAASPVLEVA